MSKQDNHLDQSFQVDSHNQLILGLILPSQSGVDKMEFVWSPKFSTPKFPTTSLARSSWEYGAYSCDQILARAAIMSSYPAGQQGNGCYVQPPGKVHQSQTTLLRNPKPYRPLTTILEQQPEGLSKTLPKTFTDSLAGKCTSEWQKDMILWCHIVCKFVLQRGQSVHVDGENWLDSIREQITVFFIQILPN